MNLILKSVFSFAVLALLFINVPTVLAADSEGIQLNPAIIEDNVDPGQSYNFSLKVTNNSDADKTFYLSVKDIKGIDEGGRPQFITEGEQTVFDLSAWVLLPQEAITVPAGETQAVPFTVNVPQDANPGAHFGSIFVDAQPPKLRETGAGIGVSVGSLISLKISGDVVEEARLRVFSSSKLVYTKLPAQFEVRVENLGNTLVKPQGFVGVVDMFGKQVANIHINDTAAGVFPSSQRSFTAAWDQQGLVFGRYQAVLSLVYGDELRKTVSASTSFWVLPLKPIGITLGTLVVLLLALYIWVRFHIQNKLKQMGVGTSNKGQAALYAKKYQQPASRITFMVIAILVFCILFLGVLLVLFA